MNFNDEFLLNETQSGEPHPELITTLPFGSPEWARVAKPWLMVPPAAPALILGAKRAASLLGREEPEWLKPFFVKTALEEE